MSTQFFTAPDARNFAVKAPDGSKPPGACLT
jgi:hypothetical protein